jgi:hypothetical protein
VDGFSGAKYKGFATQAEALQFLEFVQPTLNPLHHDEATAHLTGSACSVCRSNVSAAPRPQQANTRNTALKRKREEDDDEEEEQTLPQKPQTRRQTKLITSPFFSTPSSSSSSPSGAEPREKKRSRTVPSPTSGRCVSLLSSSSRSWCGDSQSTTTPHHTFNPLQEHNVAEVLRGQQSAGAEVGGQGLDCRQLEVAHLIDELIKQQYLHPGGTGPKPRVWRFMRELGQ